MATKPLGLAAVLSNKRTLLKLPEERLSVFKRKNHLHNYLTRYLLERASLAIKHHAARLRSADCRAKIIFSRRGGMNYDDFRDYLRLMKNGEEVIPSSGSISWEVIDPERIEALDHESRAGLQLADVSTSAIFKGVEPNVFGICERSYADDLRSRIIRKPLQNGKMGSAFGFGVTHVPTYGPTSPLTAEQRSFFESWK